MGMKSESEIKAVTQTVATVRKNKQSVGKYRVSDTLPLRIFALLTLTAVCLAVLAFGATAADTAKTEIKVKWNLGFVGSAGNRLGFENTLGSLNSPGTTYRHTDVVTIEKAGTEITFTEKGIGDSGYCAATGYFISSWIKNEKGEWILDVNGANYQGSITGKSQGIATRSGNTMTYTYVTSKDNENLRFCFCKTGDEVGGNIVFPKIYARYTGEKGTYAKQLEEDNAKVTFEMSGDKEALGKYKYGGTVSGINWFSGYVGSDKNTNFYVNEISPYAEGYRYSSIIRVPHAGTTISFTDSDALYVESEAYVFSGWQEANSDGAWTPDLSLGGIRGDDTGAFEVDKVNRTYYYITQYDGECLRLCYRYITSTEYPIVNWYSDNTAYEPETEPATDVPVESASETAEPSKPDTDTETTDNPGKGQNSSGKDIDRTVKISVLCAVGVSYAAVGIGIGTHKKKCHENREQNRDDKKG